MSGSTLHITAKKPTATSRVSWMVISERKDDFWINSKLTDSDGNLILETDA